MKDYIQVKNYLFVIPIIMPTDTLAFSELIDTLEHFKTQILECDHTHNQAHFFSLMKDFRKFVGSIHEEELCTMFFHSELYEYYKEFFRKCNNYYVRALESVEALSIISKGEFKKKSLSEIINAEQIWYNFKMKGEDLEAVEFSADKKLVMVGC